MNAEQTRSYLDEFWDKEILPSLTDFVRIPCLSPAFDPDWQMHGHMEEAVNLIDKWCNDHKVRGMETSVHRIEGLTPTLLIEVPGESDGTVLLYGHLDKQPEFTGWEEDLGPWSPVIRDNRLYGRGGGDDGYAVYAAIAALQSLQNQNVPLPRIVIIIECSEESGSPDLASYMRSFGERVGDPGLVIALDSVCGNYDQLWCTTSLRGIVAGNLRASVLNEGVHSGAAGGIVSSSFRIIRHLLSRLEDQTTGEVTPEFLRAEIPSERMREVIEAAKVLENEFKTMYTYRGNGKPLSDDPVELLLNNTWRASLEITGADGLPTVQQSGNVLRPFTAVKLSLRLPPTTDARLAGRKLQELLLADPPSGSELSFDQELPSPGWHAPLLTPQLSASLQRASWHFFNKPAMSMGCGGSIPFMNSLSNSYPDAQFVVTGVLGPHSNAHGPNEFLDIPMAKKLTGAIAQLIHDWSEDHS